MYSVLFIGIVYIVYLNVLNVYNVDYTLYSVHCIVLSVLCFTFTLTLYVLPSINKKHFYCVAFYFINQVMSVLSSMPLSIQGDKGFISPLVVCRAGQAMVITSSG